MNENHLSKALYFTDFYHFSISFLKEHGYVPPKLTDFLVLIFAAYIIFEVMEITKMKEVEECVIE